MEVNCLCKYTHFSFSENCLINFIKDYICVECCDHDTTMWCPGVGTCNTMCITTYNEVLISGHRFVYLDIDEYNLTLLQC